MLKVYDLKTEHRKNPIGIDASHPRFSWKIFSDEKNVVQSSYHILAAEDPEFENILWDSGVVESEQSLYVAYEGKEFASGQKVYWKVDITAKCDTIDNEAVSENAESNIAYFEIGLLNTTDWIGKWIEPVPEEEDIEKYQPASYLRKKFVVKEGLKRARIYQTTHGLYEFWINGKIGTEDLFNPGFTSYYHRLQYQTYDITELLRPGENLWAVLLGDGWWRGCTGGLYRNNFGYKLQFLGQILLEYEDGTKEVVGTDETFRHAQCGLRMNDMKFGNIFDASKEPENWKEVVFDDCSWSNVSEIKAADESSVTNGSDRKYLSYDLLIPSRSVPVRERETFVPKVFRDTENNLILDYGQNIAGYVKMRMHHTKPGQMISLIHSEDMKDGAFNLGNICNGLTDDPHYQQIDYIAKGAEVEEYIPQFTVFGFRYVKMEGYEEPFDPADFTAVAVYSAMEEVGDFSCSNDLINQLVKNSRWSQKGNFLDVPTDCPTRERSPWTGDSHVYAKTATEFMDVSAFFEKWLKDVAIEQYRDGRVANSVPATTSLHNPDEVERLIREEKCGFIVPGIAGPDGRPGAFDGSAGWGDTAVIIPYTMYLCYGDRTILESQYESAKKWVDYMYRCAKDSNEELLDQPEYHQYDEDGVRDADYIFDTRFHFGEWLEPGSEESGDNSDFDMEKEKKRTDSPVATAYMYYSSTLLAQMAETLGKTKDADYYTEQAKKVKRVYNRYFIEEDGTIIRGKQAPYVRTLQFGLAEEDKKEKVAEKLAEEVRNNRMRLNTGFLSTPFLLFQLLENGFKEEAFQVLENTECPGWLYPITKGATTILEDWTGLDEHANSYNHYSYGAVCDFLFSAVGGIRPIWSQPGYKKFELCPTPGGTLTYAVAEFESPYGKIVSSWKRKGEEVEYHFEIPANTTADILLPDGTKKSVGSGSYCLRTL